MEIGSELLGEFLTMNDVKAFLPWRFTEEILRILVDLILRSDRDPWDLMHEKLETDKILGCGIVEDCEFSLMLLGLLVHCGISESPATLLKQAGFIDDTSNEPTKKAQRAFQFLGNWAGENIPHEHPYKQSDPIRQLLNKLCIKIPVDELEVSQKTLEQIMEFFKVSTLDGSDGQSLKLRFNKDVFLILTMADEIPRSLVIFPLISQRQAVDDHALFLGTIYLEDKIDSPTTKERISKLRLLISSLGNLAVRTERELRIKNKISSGVRILTHELRNTLSAFERSDAPFIQLNRVRTGLCNLSEDFEDEIDDFMENIPINIRFLDEVSERVGRIQIFSEEIGSLIDFLEIHNRGEAINLTQVDSLRDEIRSITRNLSYHYSLGSLECVFCPEDWDIACMLRKRAFERILSVLVSNMAALQARNGKLHFFTSREESSAVWLKIRQEDIISNEISRRTRKRAGLGLSETIPSLIAVQFPGSPEFPLVREEQLSEDETEVFWTLEFELRLNKKNLD